MSDRPLSLPHPAAMGRDATTPLRVVAGLAMAPLVALGFARFAYALLLPAMRADLGWSYADAGAMSTANAAGYLAGALLAAPVAARLGGKVSFIAGLGLTAAALVASGLTASFAALLALRAITGAAGAIAFIVGGGFAAAAGAGGGPGRAPLALGIYFGGGGLGIVVSALAIPPLLAHQGWQEGWVCLGALSFAALALAWPALARARPPAPMPAGPSERGWSLRPMTPVLASYALYGAGYIAYATFIIAFLRKEQGFTPDEVSLFWAVLGSAAAAGAFIWGPLLGRLRAGWGVAVTVGGVEFGVVLPLCASGRAAAYLSAVLFGGAFLAVVAAVTSFARRAAPPHAWTAAIGALTVAFALGQCVGPVLSGALSDGTNGVWAGLLLSAGILLASILLAALQSEPEATPGSVGNPVRDHVTGWR